MINRLNHAVLYVRDAERSAKFYEENLGFRRIDAYGSIPNGAFLRAAGSTNDHDLALFGIGDAAADSPAGRTTVGLYHLAWEVDTLEELERIANALRQHDALVGASDHGTTKSLYGKDPDGLEFEIVWLIPKDLLDEDALRARKRIGALDLALWDIKGKVLGRPVHSLLGGMVRNFCECYPTGGVIPGIRQGMSVQERARATMEAGFRCYRSGAADAPANGPYNTHERLNKLYEESVQAREGERK